MIASPLLYILCHLLNLEVNLLMHCYILIGVLKVPPCILDGTSLIFPNEPHFGLCFRVYLTTAFVCVPGVWFVQTKFVGKSLTSRIKLRPRQIKSNGVRGSSVQCSHEEYNVLCKLVCLACAFKRPLRRRLKCFFSISLKRNSTWDLRIQSQKHSCFCQPPYGRCKISSRCKFVLYLNGDDYATSNIM